MTTDFAVTDKRKLIDLARAIVERAQLAAAALADRSPGPEAAEVPALEIQQGLEPRAVIEFAIACRQHIEATQHQVTKQLDAMLMILERFDTEITALRGEVDGLRSEQRFFLKRLGDAEEAIRDGADELVGQVSQRFLSHLENVDRAAEELQEGRKQFAAATAALLDRLQD